MKIETFQKILVDHFSAEVEGYTYTLKEGHECVLLVEHANGLMQVPSVLSVTFSDEFMVVRGEDNLYYLPQHGLFGIKGALPEQAGHRPGFRRL